MFNVPDVSKPEQEILPFINPYIPYSKVKPKGPIPGQFSQMQKATRFNMIWLRYPCKEGRKQAWRYFHASVNTPKDWQDIVLAFRNYVASDRVKNGYIQNGKTWFNNWRDWIIDPSRDAKYYIKKPGRFV